MLSPCYTSRASRVYVRPRADRMDLSPTASAWQTINYCVGRPLSLFPHLTLIEYTTVTAAPSRSPATHTNLHPRHAVYIPCLQQYKSTYVPCRTLFPCARTAPHAAIGMQLVLRLRACSKLWREPIAARLGPRRSHCAAPNQSTKYKLQCCPSAS